ncbi:hypothetical protein [Cytobacillus praedii]|uniref:hypothetical protein n=1 Tax=Cytobacillus praedii TaxID=1742358 RepID=UPI002E215E5D|nr:hypothetical protein [Cytobacillus praedii]MED3573180.1 hypothetical protein [Cytobacillus praedii]
MAAEKVMEKEVEGEIAGQLGRDLVMIIGESKQEFINPIIIKSCKSWVLTKIYDPNHSKYRNIEL